MADFVRFEKLNKEIECTKTSKKLDVKEFLVKSEGIAKNTAVALGKAGEQIVRNTSYQITDHTKDFYESDPDYAENVAKQRLAGSVYAGRFAYRGARSIGNISKKHKAKKQALKAYVKDKKQKAADVISEAKEKEIIKDGKRYVKDNKKAIYQESGIKAGLKPVQSSKRMIANQSRKAINHVKSKDTSGKVIGTSAKGIYYVARYHRAMLKTIGTVVSFAKNIFSFALGLITSSIGLLTTLVTSLPFFIILLSILLLLNFIFSLTYSGRISQFTDNEVYLEYRYQANVAPDEILSITETLGWTSEDKEDYEALFALLLDGKDENWNITYEKMLDNIFDKYNPAKYQWKDRTIKVHRENVFGIDQTEYLTYEDYLDLFPQFKSKKDIYGNEETIASMKKQAYQSLEENGNKYSGRFFDNVSFEHDPLNLKDINKNSATYKVGFRSFMDGAFHGGTDIAAAEGTDAYAVIDGKVIATYNTATASGDICTDKDKRNVALCGLNHAGNQVVIQHEIIDKRTDEKAYLYIAYFHLQKGSVKVSVGDKVSAGDVIGKTGNTGMSFGGHLHLQSWINAQDGYQLPPAANGNAVIAVNENTIDATMLCSIKFRNYIYGR